MFSKKNLIPLLVTICFIGHSQVDSVYYGEHDLSKPKDKQQKKREWKDKFFTGGNFIAVFGSSTLVNLSPFIGYKVTKDFHVGTGIIYNYSSISFNRVRYSQTIYGPQIFGRYFVVDNLFGQVEYNRLNQPNYVASGKGDVRTWVDYTYVGGGYRQKLGKNASFVMSVLFNLTPHTLSRYYYPFNPIINVGFVAGI